MTSSRSPLARAAVAAGHPSPASAAVERYAIDPDHSAIAFHVRHVFTQVPGHFTRFAGVITVDRDHLANSVVEARIETASIETRNEKRNTHLRSPDFFAVEQFPALTFKSKTWRQTGDATFDVTGDLRIKDVTKEVVLKVASLGFGPGMSPNSKLSGWSGTATINRRDFGVDGPAMLGAAVGDEVKIAIDVEAGVES